MSLLSFRPVVASDLPQCFERYAPVDRHLFDGDVLARLPSLWQSLLDEKLMTMTLWEIQATSSDAKEILGFVAWAFLEEEFAQTLIQNPTPYIANQIYRAHTEGKSLVYGEKQIADHNANGGLHLFMMHILCKKDEYNLEVAQATRILQDTMDEYYAGFNLKTIIQEGYKPLHREFSKATGWAISDYAPQQLKSHSDDTPPFFTFLSRERALSSPCGFFGTYFTYPKPGLGFSLSEQRILLLAKCGYSDAVISEKLSVSSNTLKKRWEAIFEKARDLLPGGDSDGGNTSEVQGKRGQEKRRELMRILKGRPEELRPHRG